MVSILEPFLDTIVICTVTGLVILSSGAWIEKHDNLFQRADMVYLGGQYSDKVEADREALFDYLVNGNAQSVTTYSGEIQIVDGKAVSDGFNMLHARSVAEDVRYSLEGSPFTGTLAVMDGKPANGEAALEIQGRSLLHSAALTTEAFTYSLFGEYGQYIVTIGLVLFAFSTAIAWSYYGDRAMIYLFGFKAVLPYRVVYCIGFFVASFMDTRLVWNLSAVTIVLMTLPNLFGMLLLRREMKEEMKAYVAKEVHVSKATSTSR